MELSLAIIGFFFSSGLSALAVAGAVAAVPILIHLFNRRRYVIVDFAAMRFLFAAQKKNVRRLKLEQLILLATRILIGLLLVLAMVAALSWIEPLWQKLFPGGVATPVAGGRVHRIIVLDGSFSMAARNPDGVSRFERAKAAAKTILESSAAGDGFSLIFMSSPAQTIVPGPADDAAKVLREIDDLHLPHGGADVPGGLNAVAEAIDHPLGKYARREVVFLTDLKKSSWQMLANSGDGMAIAEGQAATWQRITAAARIAFVDVAGKDIDNLAVSSLALDDPLPLVGTGTAVSAVIHNYGRADRKGIRVELLMGRSGGERVALKAIEQKLIDINAGASATVIFTLGNQNRFRVPGDHVLQVKIDADDLALDDVRSLAVTVRDSIPVMLVNGKPAPEPLETASEMLSRALDPFPQSERTPGFAARPRTLSLAQFADAGLGDLTAVDCVFLCDIPRPSSNEAARLETFLKRGGCVVIGLGPQSAKNLDAYNRVFFNEGKGILPGRLLGVKKAEVDGYFNLSAQEDAFKQAPLAAFRADADRAGLTLARFKEYVRLEAPLDGPARRLFSFLPAGKEIAPTGSLDPAVVEWPRYRGRVVVFASTFNTDWNNWPLSPTFLPFVQELLRFGVVGNNKQTLATGEPIEEFFPIKFAGLDASITRSSIEGEESLESQPVVAENEAASVRFRGTSQIGIYRIGLPRDQIASLFAVNVPVTAAGGGAESNLERISGDEVRASAADSDIQIVTDAKEIRQRRQPKADAPGNLLETVEPQGPAVARGVSILLLFLLATEMLLAWRLGSARAGAGIEPNPPRRNFGLGSILSWTFVAAALAVAAVVVHAHWTGDFLGFLPDEQLASIERSFGVPQAAPGEGTRWRLESLPYLSGDPKSDAWLNGLLILVFAAGTIMVYAAERIPSAKGRAIGALANLGSMRMAIYLLLFLVVLPQVRLSFEREGWPDLALVFDDSRSMSAVDNFRDTVLREKAEELRAAWRKIAEPRIVKLDGERAAAQAKFERESKPEARGKLKAEVDLIERRIADLRKPHRLNLIKALLASAREDWLQTFVRQKRMRLHIFRASEQVTRIAELNDPAECERALERIMDLMPEGESTQLGNAVAAIVKTFRGGSLNGIVLFTDGVTTRGEDFLGAARLAARANIPIYSVGVGDALEAPDLIISDLLVEDSINVNDRLVFDARIVWQGPNPPDAVPVILSEMKGGKKVELAREMVQLDRNGKPVKVRLATAPTEPGEKNYIVETPVQKDEVEPANNRRERQVYVAEEKRLRVLFIEGYPRYDFRYIKALFERETEKIKGNKSIDLRVLLLSAHQDFHLQDKSAIQYFPSAEELQNYDAVILGDVDPKTLPKREASLSALADFVKKRGGGLLILAGEQFTPQAYKDSPLADLLPITWDGLPGVEAARGLITQGFRLSLSPAGQGHPLFRFVGDETDNAEIWKKLQPIFWYARGYKRKLSAEVLAVHPEALAEGAANGKEERHPLILQQFVGAGRVIFFGIDETWRWRFRDDELRFNQFWIQAIRTLARARISRVEVRLDRQTAYRRDEPIKVTVRFPDDAAPPNADVPVKVLVERTPLPGGPGGTETEMQTLTLAPREGSRATFETTLTRTPEGDYRFTLIAPNLPGAKPKTEARVLPPPGEMDRLQLNEMDLQRAARETRGIYFPLNKADRLPDELPEGPRVALDQPVPPISLWNHWSLFLLFFGLLTAEWMLRKRRRLL